MTRQLFDRHHNFFIWHHISKLWYDMQCMTSYTISYMCIWHHIQPHGSMLFYLPDYLISSAIFEILRWPNLAHEHWARLRHELTRGEHRMGFAKVIMFLDPLLTNRCYDNTYDIKYDMPCFLLCYRTKFVNFGKVLMFLDPLLTKKVMTTHMIWHMMSHELTPCDVIGHHLIWYA